MNEQVAEMQRLEDLLKKQEMGDLPTNAWLDGLVYKKMMKIRNEALKAEAAALNRPDKATDTNGDSESNEEQELFYLEIEFPRFDQATPVHHQRQSLPIYQGVVRPDGLL